MIFFGVCRERNHTWSLQHKTRTEGDRRLTIEKLRGTIVYIDEVLTMSARMAAVTGNLKWEERYRKFEQELDAAIKEAMSYTSKTITKGASISDVANIKLVEMENRSFDLVQQGRMDQAKLILFSPEYEEQKKVYAQGMSNLEAGLFAIAKASLKDERQKAFLSFGAGILIILLLITIWFIAFRVVHKWEKTLISKEELEKEINEHKKTAGALQESEKRFRDLFDSMPSGVAIYEVRGNGEDFVFKDLNLAGERTSKVTRDKILGRSVLEIFPEVKKFGLFDVFENVWRTGVVTHFPGALYKDQRISQWVENVVYKLSSGEIVAIYNDITERKRAESNLQESEEKLVQAVQGNSIPTFIIDNNHIITHWNRASESLTGLSEKKMVGTKKHWLAFHPAERPVMADFIVDEATEKEIDGYYKGIHHKSMLIEGAYEGENLFPNLGKNGKWLFFTAAPLKDQDGNIIGAIQTYQDITESKRAAEQLRQAQKMEAIGTLAGGIAHDFNNILSSVIGYTELALDDVEDNNILEDTLKEVYTAGLRAKDLVKQILTFARQTDEEVKPTQVNFIVKEVLKFLRSSVPTTIEIRQNAESNSLIMGDPTQVHQILMNLCTNATQAMDEKGGVLNVDLTDVLLDANFTKSHENLKPGDYLKLSVSDTGSGIAPKNIESIFEPYFTTKAIGEGTGMGLSTVHGIVKQYGGEIMVDSEVERGSTFNIYLPISKKRMEVKPYQAEVLPSGNERILVVDDELPIAKMSSQILQKLGYDVMIRTSSVEALELFRAKPNDFDLVITDMTMPNMTGDKLAAELIAIKPDIAVILCTGYSRRISDETTAAIGIKALVHKPVVRADLAKTIRKVLDEAKGSGQG